LHYRGLQPVELRAEDGRVSEFQGGAIFWTPEHGAEVRFRID
jgi:uncharacterized protein with LGFP repeats